jgi:hypothetical protein
MKLGALFEDERWWKNQFPHIFHRGYVLPEEYNPERKRKRSDGESEGESGFGHWQPTTVSALFSRYQS